MKDHYSTLGISHAASPTQIKSAYRQLAKKYHPDKNNGSKAAEEAFKHIYEAYAVLSNPGKKQKYDLKLKYGSEPKQAQRKSYSPPTQQKGERYKSTVKSHYQPRPKVKQSLKEWIIQEITTSFLFIALVTVTTLIGLYLLGYFD